MANEKLRHPTNHFTRAIYKGCVVEVWESLCKDCGFESGLARVTFPDGRAVTFSGAGCFDRRDRAVVEARAKALIEETLP